MKRLIILIIFSVYISTAQDYVACYDNVIGDVINIKPGEAVLIKITHHMNCNYDDGVNDYEECSIAYPDDPMNNWCYKDDRTLTGIQCSERAQEGTYSITLKCLAPGENEIASEVVQYTVQNYDNSTGYR